MSSNSWDDGDLSGRPPLNDPNPLLGAWERAVGERTGALRRDELVHIYGFAIPDEPALDTIRRVSPRGVVEVGAGTGYWARLLEERDVDVVAVDIAPPPHPANRWFAGSPPWTTVAQGDESIVDHHGSRSLLMVWPTRDEAWPARGVLRYAHAGGTVVLRVGEPPGGGTGDDQFHALLGIVDRCWSCAYGSANSICVCGTTPLFEPVDSVEIPQWEGFDDALWVHRRTHRRPPLGRAVRRRWRPAGRRS